MNRRRWMLCLLAAFVTQSLQLTIAQQTADGSAGARNNFTSELLGMPRTQILLSDRMLRIFNGRGAVSPREKSVTGLQELEFPHIAVSGYDFFLSFRSPDSSLIEDNTADFYKEWVERDSGWDHNARKLTHPLGVNTYPETKYPQGPYALLLQNAYWEPNLFCRTGTFHTLMGGRWISFAIKTETSASADADEIYLKVTIENRQAAPLDFTVIANQRVSPRKPTPQPDAYTINGDYGQITVVSDLYSAAGGWHWPIPGRATKTAFFALIVQKPGESAPLIHQTDLALRAESAKNAIKERLRWASSRLPAVSTNDSQFDELYRRSILTILESKWQGSGVPWEPFYSVGTWIQAVPWDVSYTSEGLSILDPEGLRENFLHYFRTNTSRYVQNKFALLRILQDYLRQTGDVAFLDHKENGRTVFDLLKQNGKDIEDKYGGRSDGLLDYGGGQQNFLEMRTDGYDHVVAAYNGLAIAYFRQMAQWCRERNDADATRFQQWSAQIQKALNEKLWDPGQNWFINLAPDNSSNLVWSYHEFDLLDTDVLSKAQEAGMISHLREGEFLAPYGIYSVSKADTIHWDLEDVDWGGGGQYTGEPLRLVESLYHLGYGELAWNILSRCTLWTKYYPYIPQEIFGDSPTYPEIEMPAALAAGAGVQAIVSGVFGLRPQQNGVLQVSPFYHHELGHATLRDYHFRSHSYDVVLDAERYRVFRDGKLVVSEVYGNSTSIMN